MKKILGILILVLLFPTWGFAEVKVFEKEVEEIVSRGQSQEQVEAFALQKAKRLAVEEAGTYISSLTVVLNYQLKKDEVTALASGVVQAKIVGIPAVRLESGVVHVKVKARIEVDTSVLDRQIEIFMRDKGALKERDEALKKMRELENQLTNLKSSEGKRLEELNAQALALERERDRQRLFMEEQSLKAKGELSKAEADRLAKERELQERVNRTLAEQEKAKRAEALALAAEQDRIKRAQLENEQRWNELARKAKLAQDQWAAIDDSLSLKQAVIEVKDMKGEIVNLKGRLKFTTARVTHLGTKEAREFRLEMPRIFAEIDQFGKFKEEETTAKKTSEQAARLLSRKKINVDGRFTAYDDGTVLDTQTGLMWAAKDNGADINWQNAKSYCENYRGGGYSDWRMPTQNELAGLYDRAKPYESACGYNAYLTELIRLTCAWAWASETSGSDAAGFAFGGGGRLSYPQSGGGYTRALPVRSGK